MRLQVSGYAGHVWDKVKSNSAVPPPHVLLGAGVAPFRLFQVWFAPDREIAIISEDSIPAHDSECLSQLLLLLSYTFGSQRKSNQLGCLDRILPKSSLVAFHLAHQPLSRFSQSVAGPLPCGSSESR
jgi:hypothetical protein